MLDIKNLSFGELNDRFTEWIETEYHKKIHSTIQQTPISRYLTDLEHTQIMRLSEDELKLIFYQTIKRKVNNDSTVSISGVIYETPPKYIGKFIEIRFASDNKEELFIFENDKPVFNLKKVDTAFNSDIIHTPIFSMVTT